MQTLHTSSTTEPLEYFEPQDDPLDPQITKGNKIGKAVVEMTKGIDVLKNHIESITEKQDVFIDANGKETINYEPLTIQFKDKTAEATFKQMQAAYEDKIQSTINTISKPKDPGPNATADEKAKYFKDMQQYGMNVGLTKAVMEMSSPRQELINSLINDPHAKKKPVVIQPLPLIRPRDH